MEELLEKLTKTIESLKEHGKFEHLFSKDKAQAEIAELRENLREIKTHVKISSVKEIGFAKNDSIKEYWGAKTGCLVSVRPCDPKYNDKTFVGVLIGEAALGSSISIEENKIQCNFASYNPAIIVPELNEVIFGCQSWWGEIKSIDDFKEISNTDINNTWYVQLFKSMNNATRKSP